MIRYHGRICQAKGISRQRKKSFYKLLLQQFLRYLSASDSSSLERAALVTKKTLITMPSGMTSDAWWSHCLKIRLKKLFNCSLRDMALKLRGVSTRLQRYLSLKDLHSITLISIELSTRHLDHSSPTLAWTLSNSLIMKDRLRKRSRAIAKVCLTAITTNKIPKLYN